jgi:protein tyrosine phosphatase (PTP) superfamily phosphohydrolase (DUF442 family)
MYFRLLMLTLALSGVLATGCRNQMHRQPPQSCPPSMSIPPAGIYEGPPATPAPRNNGGAELLLPQSPPPGKSRSEYPKIIPAVPERKGAILGEPEAENPPEVVESKPPAEKKADNASGIADFVEVKEGIATGRRPTIDGLDWLKSNSYKSIVYLRPKSKDDASDKRQVELRDMKYTSMVVSADTLSQDWIDEFNRVVGQSAAQPIFVYGDAADVGPIWYLHLRTAQFLTHDEAIIRAKRYGLKDEDSELMRAALRIAPPNG